MKKLNEKNKKLEELEKIFLDKKTKIEIKFCVRGPKQLLKNKEFEEDCHQKYQECLKIRSEVIDKTLSIEDMLDHAILHFLVGKDSFRHDLLKAFVLNAEFCTLMQKRKMLSKMLKMFPDNFSFLAAEERKKILRDLQNFILQRNMFVHGQIIINIPNMNVTIKHYREKIIETEINEKTLLALKEKYSYLLKQLYKIKEFLKENRRDE